MKVDWVTNMCVCQNEAYMLKHHNEGTDPREHFETQSNRQNISKKN